MRILVVGAGSVGGYFGGRLLEAGRDVTFLVRAPRAAALAATGLSIRSPAGNVDLPAPVLTPEGIRDVFDLIILSTKAYDVTGAMDSLAPAVGSRTVILPLLNGLAHLDDLDARFGAEHVLGGQCRISATLDPAGRVLHIGTAPVLSFGARDGSCTLPLETISTMLSNASFEAVLSGHILQDMWEKWVFIAAAAGITCLMRASIGDIVQIGGSVLSTAMLAECVAVATACAFPPTDASVEWSRATLTTAGSALTASMLRDIERYGRTEGDHTLGDLVRRGRERGVDTPLLRIAHAHVSAYEARRHRESTGTAGS